MTQIPKIELKITAAQLTDVCNALDFIRPILTFEDRQKVRKLKNYYSLLDVVRLKLAKKLLTHANKTKPFKLSLQYYEANCIHETLKVTGCNHEGQKMFNQLDQKLA